VNKFFSAISLSRHHASLKARQYSDVQEIEYKKHLLLIFMACVFSLGCLSAVVCRWMERSGTTGPN